MEAWEKMSLFLELIKTQQSAMSLRNQKCMTQPTLINLDPNEYSHKFHYYPFAVKLDRLIGSCNTLNELSKKTWSK